MMKFEKGHLAVPQKPGIGVELDRTKVRKYADLYKREVRGSELSGTWGAPHKLLGLPEPHEEWLPIAARW
jgi:hypothetical protein